MYWFDIAWTLALIVVVPMLILSVIQVVRSRALSWLGKVIWLLVIVLVPIIGSVLWFAFKPATVAARAS